MQCQTSPRYLKTSTRHQLIILDGRVQPAPLLFRRRSREDGVPSKSCQGRLDFRIKQSILASHRQLHVCPRLFPLSPQLS